MTSGSIKSQTNSTIKFEISQDIISKLELNPSTLINGVLSGQAYQAKIIIPNYDRTVQDYYKDQLTQPINHYFNNLKLPALFKHFGVCISFTNPVEIHLHNLEMQLESSAKNLINLRSG